MYLTIWILGSSTTFFFPKIPHVLSSNLAAGQFVWASAPACVGSCPYPIARSTINRRFILVASPGVSPRKAHSRLTPSSCALTNTGAAPCHPPAPSRRPAHARNSATPAHPLARTTQQAAAGHTARALPRASPCSPRVRTSLAGSAAPCGPPRRVDSDGWAASCARAGSKKHCPTLSRAGPGWTGKSSSAGMAGWVAFVRWFFLSKEALTDRVGTKIFLCTDTVFLCDSAMGLGS
jgi:hypothetical protein